MLRIKAPDKAESAELVQLISQRVGPLKGHKALMIRTIRSLDRPDPGLERVANANGFSLGRGRISEFPPSSTQSAGKPENPCTAPR